jgi:hypothetical protein
MRHAGPDTLDELEPLLTQLRDVPWLVEKKRGVFYRRSRPFLHFHEDPSGIHADVRVAADWERMRVHTAAERRALLGRVRRAGAISS